MMLGALILLSSLLSIIMSFRAGNRYDYRKMFLWFVLFAVILLAIPILGDADTNCINYIDDFGVYHCIDKKVFFNNY